jgi:hypothetical protein
MPQVRVTRKAVHKHSHKHGRKQTRKATSRQEGSTWATLRHNHIGKPNLRHSRSQRYERNRSNWFRRKRNRNRACKQTFSCNHLYQQMSWGVQFRLNRRQTLFLTPHEVEATSIPAVLLGLFFEKTAS